MLAPLFYFALTLPLASPAAEPWELEREVLYFVMVDRFADGDPTHNAPPHPERQGAFQGGDLKGILARLGYLEELGVSALWLTPLARQVDTEVYGAGFRDTAYHGYWPRDLEGIDPRFGTAADLHALVQAAHSRGIKVVLDVVTNHVGYGSPLAKDAARVRSGSGCPAPGEGTELTSCLHGLPDLKTEKPEVAAWVIDKTALWAERYGVDGYRLDAMKHVHAPVFRGLNQRLAKRGPGGGPFFTLGEVWGARPELDGPPAPMRDGLCTTLIDFGFSGLMESFLSGRMRAEAFAHHLEARHRAPGPPMAHFLDSHDTQTFIDRLGPARRHLYPLAGLVQMTTRGIPIVTWGNEVGRQGGAWPENREFMPWTRTQRGEGRELLRHWKAFIHARRAHAALSGRSFKVLHARTAPEGGADVVYERGDPSGSRFLIALRRGAGAGEVELALTPGERLAPCYDIGGTTLIEAPTVAGGRSRLVLPRDGGALLERVPAGAVPTCR